MKIDIDFLIGIIRRIDPVVDDLMGEATGKRPVQDWGAVNDLLVDAAKAIQDYEKEN